MLDNQFASKNQSWNHYLKFGGYPAIIDKGLTDDERYDWLKDYVRTYLERDIRDLASFRELEPFFQSNNLGAASSVNTAIKSLIEKEFIFKENEKYYLADRFFEGWMLQKTHV
jgi:predicted AAA+ superfamily ATPase